MGFFAFLLLGLIAGAIAKAILPGRQAGGWFITLLLGVVVMSVNLFVDLLYGLINPRIRHAR